MTCRAIAGTLLILVVIAPAVELVPIGGLPKLKVDWRLSLDASLKGERVIEYCYISDLADGLARTVP